MSAIDSLEAKIQPLDDRRKIIILDSVSDAIDFATRYWIKYALKAISQKGFFCVALSGGSTPNAIYKLLASPAYREQINWNCVKFFWSDERWVPHDHPESNFGTAMRAGLNQLPISQENLFPMPTHYQKAEEAALAYEKIIKREVAEAQFDLIMLGMGEDGHTASLFPRTHALDVEDRLVAANYVPAKETWRLTLTYRTINNALKSTILSTGSNKAEMCHQVLRGPYDFYHLPIQKVGTIQHPVLWILDQLAASKLNNNYA